ncbi:hypothetical protein [Pseudomonas frederiksbergensis]|uniref:hypothetical protein n=1 Tax=Pseudomonas frederiksbergensis TaxID=104087 RepID=UPI003D1D2318
MRVCSGVFIGWYGADVTPGIFYENFIDVMVTIDANDGWQNGLPARLIIRHRPDPLWRGGLPPLGCEAAPKPAIATTSALPKAQFPTEHQENQRHSKIARQQRCDRNQTLEHDSNLQTIGQALTPPIQHMQDKRQTVRHPNHANRHQVILLRNSQQHDQQTEDYDESGAYGQWRVIPLYRVRDRWLHCVSIHLSAKKS